MGHIKPVVVVRGDLPGTGRRRVDGLGPEVAVVDGPAVGYMMWMLRAMLLM